MCEEIISRFHALNNLSGLKSINITHTHHRYPIIFGSVFHIDDVIKSLGLSDHQPVIITSDALAETLKKPLDLITSKLNAVTLYLKDGEQHKNMAAIHKLHEQMFEQQLTRKSVVLALGGGNVGDVAGFAASIFLRGVPYIQVPTTMLAMVDSSIGGKTGVDNEHGKNLVGAFYTPKAVLIDEEFLKTLPPTQTACGMAEIIKHAIIADRDLFNKLKHDFDTSIIAQALKVKANIVFSDPYEQNIRAHLNLGHTYAHAIEKISRYEIKHGLAVAMGLVLATHMSKKLGLLEEDFLPELLELLEKYHLPTQLPKNIELKAVIAAMQHDKKRDHQGLNLILPQKVGQVMIKAVKAEDFYNI